MAVKTFSTGEVLTAADTNTYLNNGGLVYITQLSYSGTSSANIDNCFTTSFDHYLIVNSCYGSANSNVSIKMRAGGSTDSSNNYYTQGLYPNNNATGYVYNWPVATGNFIGNYGNSVTEPGMQTVSIWNPQTAVKTGFYSQWESTQSGLGGFTNGTMATTTQYDGLALIAGSGTITGKIRVYGYRQA